MLWFWNAIGRSYIPLYMQPNRLGDGDKSFIPHTNELWQARIMINLLMHTPTIFRIEQFTYQKYGNQFSICRPTSWQTHKMWT